MATNSTETYFHSLLSFYAKRQNSKYIISRIIKSNLQFSPTLLSLFCNSCVKLFIPTVNCKMRVCEDKVMILCKKCENTLFFRLEYINLGDEYLGKKKSLNKLFIDEEK